MLQTIAVKRGPASGRLKSREPRGPGAPRATSSCSAPRSLLGRMRPNSDQSSQYLSTTFRELLEDAGFVHSCSRRGNSLDNSPMESFFSTTRCRALDLVALCPDAASTASHTRPRRRRASRRRPSRRHTPSRYAVLKVPHAREASPRGPAPACAFPGASRHSGLPSPRVTAGRGAVDDGVPPSRERSRAGSRQPSKLSRFCP